MKQYNRIYDDLFERRNYVLNIFKKDKKEIVLYAPVDGKSMALEEVPDKMFAGKMLGDGIAFTFDGNTVCAPTDGKITMIADTLHAFGMVAENGAEILIHIGMDTVNLQGKGFKKLVEPDSKVKKGMPIIELDRAFLAENGVNLTTPMIITNGDDYSFKVEAPKNEIRCGEDGVIFFR